MEEVTQWSNKGSQLSRRFSEDAPAYCCGWERRFFFVGDAYLYEIKHVNFLVSATVGILGGSLVMLMGAGIAVACKSPKPEQR
jgi:hypothetical protein